MGLKIKTRRDGEIALVFFKIGFIMGIVFVSAILGSALVIKDLFTSVEYFLVIILWAMIWIMIIDDIVGLFLRTLLKLFEVEFVE